MAAGGYDSGSGVTGDAGIAALLGVAVALGPLVKRVTMKAPPATTRTPATASTPSPGPRRETPGTTPVAMVAASAASVEGTGPEAGASPVTREGRTTRRGPSL